MKYIHKYKRNIYRFIIVGLSNTILSFMVTNLCYYFTTLGKTLSVITGFIFGVIYTYLLHSLYTFNSRKINNYYSIIKYTFYMLINLTIALIITNVLVENGIFFIFSQVIVTIVLTILNFLISNHYIFNIQKGK